MKKKIFLVGALIASMAFTSCSDFLDEDPKGKLTAETYFSTQEEVNMAMYALYQKVNKSQIYTNMQYPQWQGDDITANPGSNKQACAEMDKFAPVNSNKGVRDSWNMHYVIVKAANYIIENEDKIRTTCTKDEADLAIGNAKYWRAYAYFYLVRLFGPLPMPLDGTVDDYTLPLTSVEGVYAQIEKDLADAEGMCPIHYSGSPRQLNGVDTYVTKGAVQATEAAVFMTMAGWPLNKNEYYAKAAEKAKLVIDNKDNYGYTMDSDYKLVYSMANNYNTETVLGINFSPFAEWAQDSELTSCCLFESLGGWGDAWGEIKFWQRFPEGPRKDATYDPKIRLKDGSKLVDWWEKREDGSNYIPECHPMFSVFTVNAEDPHATYDYTKAPWRGMCNDHRHRLIRYSEVLLWYAEAKARSGQVDDLAKQCLIQVRSRAVNPEDVNTVNGVDIMSMNAKQLAEAAYDEHGWEVAGYWVALMTRRGDQFRMDRLKETFAERAANAPIEVADGVSVKESVELTNKTWDQKLMYLPYPQADAEKNPNLVR